jgi:hypothetical protein
VGRHDSKRPWDNSSLLKSCSMHYQPSPYNPRVSHMRAILIGRKAPPCWRLASSFTGCWRRLAPCASTLARTHTLGPPAFCETCFLRPGLLARSDPGGLRTSPDTRRHKTCFANRRRPEHVKDGIVEPAALGTLQKYLDACVDVTCGLKDANLIGSLYTEAHISHASAFVEMAIADAVPNENHASRLQPHQASLAS